MPSTNQTESNISSVDETSTKSATQNPKTVEYEYLQLHLLTKTKRIDCNNQTSGSIFWIPDGYRPLLVRTSDIPLLVGTEYPITPSSSPSSFSSEGEYNN
nr:11318_t:CDS:2 [Entrophospora candida]